MNLRGKVMDFRLPDHAKQQIPIYIVMPTLGGPHVDEVCLKILSVLSYGDKLLVVKNGEKELGISQSLKHDYLIYHVNSREGACINRNYGIEQLEALIQDSNAGIIFANDRSIYSDKSLSSARLFLERHSNAIGIGTWRSLDGSLVIEPRKQYLSKTDLLRAYEPAMIIPSGVLRRGLRWNEELGPGPSTRYKSGDGALFLADSMELGATLISVPEFEVFNPLSNYSLTTTKLFRKAFQYGLGYISYLKFVNSGKFLVQVHIAPYAIAPIILCVLGKSYWRKNGIAWSLGATAGRIWGLLAKNRLGN